MRQLLFTLTLFISAPLFAATEAPEELKLLSENPVAGMEQGNLSGLAWCGDALWAVSDREDGRVYRLNTDVSPWQAEAETFVAPPLPDNMRPWGMKMRGWITGLIRGGDLDFEGISCDSAGNRYLLSEAHAGVLKMPPAGEPEWLTLPKTFMRQARASGLLLHFNAMLEGIALDPAGERMWLAAERERRGLLALYGKSNNWRCQGPCVLQSESGVVVAPKLGAGPVPKDYSDLSFYQEKLFTLERQAHQICRRELETGAVERCWSFAEAALTDARRYDSKYGMAEALWIDPEGAWLGLDTGAHTRADGEDRSIVWRFAAPKGGWEQAE